jgi:hypothetical protein
MAPHEVAEARAWFAAIDTVTRKRKEVCSPTPIDFVRTILEKSVRKKSHDALSLTSLLAGMLQ